jgi:hypothetical protein
MLVSLVVVTSSLASERCCRGVGGGGHCRVEDTAKRFEGRRVDDKMREGGEFER